jgi:hypothetical protein
MLTLSFFEFYLIAGFITFHGVMMAKHINTEDPVYDVWNILSTAGFVIFLWPIFFVYFPAVFADYVITELKFYARRKKVNKANKAFRRSEKSNK